MGKQEHKKNIGILGGSFNPAHEGHVHISMQALEILGLDEIWWMVSPQNPNKPKEGMAPFEERFVAAQQFVKSIPNIVVSDFEKNNKTQYTYDTIVAMHKKYSHNFIWLMGADNMATFHKWHKWQDIFKKTPIAVFDRGDFAIEALASDAAHEFAEYKIAEENARDILVQKAPAWCFFEIEKHPASSTEIRQNSE